jgi:hypothetical protein
VCRAGWKEKKVLMEIARIIIEAARGQRESERQGKAKPINSIGPLAGEILVTTPPKMRRGLEQRRIRINILAQVVYSSFS